MFSDSNRPLLLCQALPALSGLPSSGEGPEPPPLLLLLWPCVQRQPPICSDSPCKHPLGQLRPLPPSLGPSFPGLGLACAMPGPGLRAQVWGPDTPSRQFCDRPGGSTLSQLTRGALEVLLKLTLGHQCSQLQPRALLKAVAIL